MAQISKANQLIKVLCITNRSTLDGSLRLRRNVAACELNRYAYLKMGEDLKYCELYKKDTQNTSLLRAIEFINKILHKGVVKCSRYIH